MRLLRDATSRLVAAHMALVTLPTAAALGFVHVSAGGVVDAEMRQVVEAELRGLADDYGQAGVHGLARAIERRLSPTGRADAIYLLAADDGRRIAGNLVQWPPTLAPGAGWATLDLYRAGASGPTTISAVAVGLPGGQRLLVGRDVASRAAFDRTLSRALILSLLGVAVVALVTGWLLSRLVLGRIGDIAATAGRIAAGASGERIAERGTGDEFDRLALGLNAMIDRNAALVRDLRMVTDSLAHDLRSPLGRLRRHIEAARDPVTSVEDRDDMLARAADEAEGMLAVSTALLELSRIEAGIGAEQFVAVDLAALARDMADLYGAAAEDSGMALSCAAPTPAPVRGHPQLLAQAASNLVENALRYGASGRVLRIGAELRDGVATLFVEDRGPGVPEADRSRVRDRFVRLDPARGGRGAGLGLALVDAVARMHGGALALGDAAPGLRAELRLPSASAGMDAAAETAR
jgi:signal transduction histidine kinase